MTRNIANC